MTSLPATPPTTSLTAAGIPNRCNIFGCLCHCCILINSVLSHLDFPTIYTHTHTLTHTHTHTHTAGFRTCVGYTGDAGLICSTDTLLHHFSLIEVWPHQRVRLVHTH